MAKNAQPKPKNAQPAAAQVEDTAMEQTVTEPLQQPQLTATAPSTAGEGVTAGETAHATHTNADSQPGPTRPADTDGDGARAAANPATVASVAGANTPEDSQAASQPLLTSGEGAEAPAETGAAASAPGSDPVRQAEARAYAVRSPLKHNGKKYGPGTQNPTVFMTEGEAETLVAIGVLEEPQE